VQLEMGAYRMEQACKVLHIVASLMLLLGVKLLCISLLSSATCSGDNTEERKVVSGNFSSCSTVMFMYWSSPISSFSGL